MFYVCIMTQLLQFLSDSHRICWVLIVLVLPLICKPQPPLFGSLPNNSVKGLLFSIYQVFSILLCYFISYPVWEFSNTYNVSSAFVLPEPNLACLVAQLSIRSACPLISTYVVSCETLSSQSVLGPLFSSFLVFPLSTWGISKISPHHPSQLHDLI